MSKNNRKEAVLRKAAEHARAKEHLIDLNRRRFLKNSAASMAGATMALSNGKKGIFNWAEAQTQRPYLISIHLPQGWDTNWFHMAFPKRFVSTAEDNPNLISGHNDRSYDDVFPKPVTNAERGSDPFGRRVDTDPNGVLLQYYHNLYTERTKEEALVFHPGYSASNVASAVPGQHHFLGLGAQHAFGGLNGGVGLFNKMCVWKGLFSGGAHDVPNRNIIHGSESQYAISYSGLIAESLAYRYGKLQLNYVQLTSSPGEYGANWAMSKRDQIPINCADQPTLRKLTQRNAKDFSDNVLYRQVNASVEKLGGQLGKERFTLARSKDIYSEFIRFFKGALGISELGTNMDGFLSVWQAYANYALDRVYGMSDRSFINKISPEVVLPFRGSGFNQHLYSPFVPNIRRQGESEPQAGTSTSAALYSTELADARKAISTNATEGKVPFEANEASLQITTGVRGMIARAAWRFAMAEFMITGGYSSVVDMVIGTGDAHGDNAGEMRLLMAVYSCYGKLMERLQTAGYLDRTLIVVFSEFDRTAALMTDTSTVNRGTGHDTTESILMAGYGIKQGTVFGDRAYGNSSGPAVGDFSLIDSEGKASSLRGQVNYSYVFPTIMKIFNVAVPANQITDASAVSNVIA